MNEKKYEGVVCWFSATKGYGFISFDVDGIVQTDIFCHFSDVSCEGFKTLHKDQKVSFAIGVNKRGEPKAIDIKVISS
jgi:CspA family cold shock protein